MIRSWHSFLFLLALLTGIPACSEEEVPSPTAPAASPAEPRADQATRSASEVKKSDAVAPPVQSLDAAIQTPDIRDAARREAMRKFQQSKNENLDRR